MKTVKYGVEYEEPAGRLELFIRWIWAIPSLIVMMVLSIIAAIACVVQWFHILILAKRNRTLQDWMFKYYAYHTKFIAYFNLLTDERNPIMPED